MSAIPLPQSAGRLRHFNRFYTRQIGLLDRSLNGSGRSLSRASPLALRNLLAEQAVFVLSRP